MHKHGALSALKQLRFDNNSKSVNFVYLDLTNWA